MEDILENKALEEIIQWSQAKPAWIKSTINLLCKKEALNDEEVSNLYTICTQKDGVENTVKIDELQSPPQTKHLVQLKAIKNVKNANALADGQILTFAKTGMTVIYGDNGSGKSGYVRILKQVCRTRYRENVESNIYKHHANEEISAEIEYLIDGENKKIYWKGGAQDIAQLTSVSIFDSKSANVHVDEANNIAYSPFPIRLLERLAEYVIRINSILDQDIRKLEGQTPEFLKNFIRNDTLVAQAIQKLKNGSLENATLRKLAVFAKEDEETLRQLELDSVNDPLKQIDHLNNILKKLDTYKAKMDYLSITLNSETFNVFFEKSRVLKEKEVASSLVAEKLLNVSDLPNVGTDIWKHLWEAARKYSQEYVYKDKAYPNTDIDAKCVLCQQQIDDKVKNRFNEFENFVKSELEQEISQLKNEQEKALYKFINDFKNFLDIHDVLFFIKNNIGDSVLSKDARKFLLQTKWNLRKFIRNHIRFNEVVIIPAQYPQEKIKAAIENINTRIKNITEQAGGKFENSRKELREIKDRQWLCEHFKDISYELERKTEIAKLKACKFNTKSITDKNKEISKNLVTSQLRGEFAKEIAKLGLTNLSIELTQTKSDGGIPKFQISLIHKPGKKVGSVLSEGEYRCIAIASFFAELSIHENHSTIIFDDPVSSLDHIHRDNVAKRLVDASKSQQVIIFTHDLSFLFTLLENNKAVHDGALHNFSLIGIAKNHEATGYCNNNPPVRAQSVDMRIKGIKTHFDNVKIHYHNGDQEKWEREVKGITEDLREIWEVSVEAVLSPVVKRLANKIDTKGIFEVAIINEEDCIVMRDAYGRCSKLCHTNAATLNPRLPVPEDIENEIETIRNWYDDIMARQKVARAY